jgi:Protein of unknown function (DUF1329)
MRLTKLLVSCGFVSIGLTGAALAGVSADEAKQLGTALTLFGAEKAGNKEGTIPEYTGGLPTSTAPAGFKKGSGAWANPFVDEKPAITITAQNMEQYTDKLSEVSKALLKRYPSYRIDVYPTHRSIGYPKYILDATVRNATGAKTANDGLSVEGYQGVALEWDHRNFYVDANGKQIGTGDFHLSQQFPNQREGNTPEKQKKDGNFFFQAAYNFTGPPRVLGDATLYMDTMDPVAAPRRSWSYSASTRRVRLSPDVAYDTPIASVGGVTAYDDVLLFSGKMDRFDFKLIGKKEIFIPYNSYDLSFKAMPDKVLTPKHLNPDFVRWELHRVWVVEATLKPGTRHIYSKRVFYLDEDWSGAGLSDEYDNAGKLYKGLMMGSLQLYDVQTPFAWTYWGYDLSTGLYCLALSFAGTPGVVVKDDLFTKSTYSADGLVARSKQ